MVSLWLCSPFLLLKHPFKGYWDINNHFRISSTQTLWTIQHNTSLDSHLFQTNPRNFNNSVETEKYGLVDVKPLGVIWGKYPQYTAQNTIMFDDLRRNFLMNPQNGLKIRPFREAHKNRSTDNELVGLAKYLSLIAKLEDLSDLRHSRWERYNSDH